MATVSERKPGIWKVQYRAPDPSKGGRLVQRSFTVRAPTKREAQALADERELDERRVHVAPNQYGTVADYLIHWSNNRPDTSKGKPPAPKTVERDKQYVQVINRHVGAVRMRDVGKGTFDALVAGLRSDGYSSRTVKNTWSCLKKAMREAWRNDLIRDDPSAKARAPHVPRSEATYATFEDVVETAGYLKGHMGRPDLAVYVRLIFSTGCRPAEMLAITWSDIDRNTHTINVDKTVTEAGDYQVRRETKTDSSTDVVDYAPSIDDALSDLHRVHLETKADRGLHWNPEGYVWPGADGLLPIRPTSLGRRVRDALRAIGIDHLTLYSFRHGSGTYMLEGGASIKEVQDHLRHSTAQLTTDTYLHVTERLRERKRSMFDGV
ncbi:tyrosine-type recombinase/integrase [Ruegeria arenilitoris]|uniref:tyrosine-type recombinase/integrase n=1 Tax=Ruegeria arenilitoris TaxID=1173585 RepID=UPI00147E7704|nr:tyrosine-type recombinase/integrase [Ruegeria arenilitoris]